MSDFDPGADGDRFEEVPDWDDEYVDRVSGRLMHSYDLERDRAVEGHRFALYGRLAVERSKHFLHPSVTYADHELTEHLFVRRAESVSVADLEGLAEVGDRLADTWIEADEEHYGTEFVFGILAPEIPDEARSYVEGFESRTLLKYGYYGHYAVRLFVVAPEKGTAVASPGTDVVSAFRVWDDGEKTEPSGVLDRLRAALIRFRFTVYR